MWYNSVESLSPPTPSSRRNRMSNDANKKPPKKNAPLTPAEEETLSGEALDATRLSIGGDTQTVAGAHTSRMPAPVTGTPRDKKRKKKKLMNL